MDDQSLVYTLDDALTFMGFGKFQGLALVYSGLGWFAEAMEVMILSFVGSAVTSEWGLSSSEESIITTVVFGGMLVGAYSWGLISDSYGRRNSILGGSILTSVAGLLSAISPNYVSLVILRGLVGVGLGSGHVFFSWFLEFVPPSNRGMWMIVFSTFWTFGSVSEAALAWIVMPRWNWRWLLALSAIPSFIVLIFISFMPESPRYLCTKGRIIDAYNILEKIAQFNRVDLPSGTHPILLSESVQDSSLYIDVFITSFAELPGLLLAAIIVDRVGRKSSMTIMFILVCIFLFPLVTHQSNFLTIALLSGARMCSMGTFIIANIFAPEIYPTSMRSTGAGVAYSMGRIGGMICPLVAVGLVTSCHQTGAIILLGVVIVLSVVSILLIPFETKGKELSDTIDDVSNSKQALDVR
ncbi:Organic cation/carnitine transporter 7 [Melia azedarach]|uniref:Organic cation/carnitine transporter 7 n=1 Tax=Melia azedarach TaxID=155640 RepID=A0ACC1XFQ7_MELAZ|nr:Organic cation/carnitine transporter 7 [Melia azedarach]